LNHQPGYQSDGGAVDSILDATLTHPIRDVLPFPLRIPVQAQPSDHAVLDPGGMGGDSPQKNRPGGKRYPCQPPIGRGKNGGGNNRIKIWAKTYPGKRTGQRGDGGCPARLDVAVDDVHGVEVRETLEDLPDAPRAGRLRQRRRRGQAPVLVGGGVTSREWSQNIGTSPPPLAGV